MCRRCRIASTAGALALLAWALAAGGETHWDVQAVDGAGEPTYPKVGASPADPNNKVILEGIVLNNHEDMLDPTAAYCEIPWDLGAQWQIYVQGEGGDHAGTACWMGQNYGNMPWIGDPQDNNYSDAEWDAEMARVNYDGAHHIRRGDRVRVSGFLAGYGGKTNVNERHNKMPLMDFTVEYLGRAGVGAPEPITLGDVKTGANQDIFDPNRTSGGEYYQGRLVRINQVSFVDPGAVGRYQHAEIADGTGRTLGVWFGDTDVWEGPLNLAASFDVVGIFNQEGNYEMWSLAYNGKTKLLGCPLGDVTANTDVDAADIDALYDAIDAAATDEIYDLDNDGDADGDDVDFLVRQILQTEYGDANLDRRVNVGDLGILGANYGQAGRGWANGNFNGDGIVNVADLGMLGAHYGFGAGGAVPEPACASWLVLAGGALLAKRRRRCGHRSDN